VGGGERDDERVAPQSSDPQARVVWRAAQQRRVERAVGDLAQRGRRGDADEFGGLAGREPGELGQQARQWTSARGDDAMRIAG
jgi:hypothetical protein